MERFALTEQLALLLSSSRALSRRGQSLQLAAPPAVLAFHRRPDVHVQECREGPSGGAAARPYPLWKEDVRLDLAGRLITSPTPFAPPRSSSGINLGEIRFFPRTSGDESPLGFL